MISTFYSVKDLKVGVYLPAFCLQNDISAVRAFGYSVRDKTVQTNLSLYPADFELYKVGTFDDQSGVITGGMPVFVCSAVSCIGDPQ